MRCPCWIRVDFSIQCKYELTVNIKFKKYHWAHRCNRREFNSHFSQIYICNTNPNIINIEDVDPDANCNKNSMENDCDVNRGVNCIQNDNSYEFTIQNSILQNENYVVSYKDVLEVAADLCGTISDGQILCKSVYASL